MKIERECVSISQLSQSTTFVIPSDDPRGMAAVTRDGVYMLVRGDSVHGYVDLQSGTLRTIPSGEQIQVQPQIAKLVILAPGVWREDTATLLRDGARQLDESLSLADEMGAPMTPEDRQCVADLAAKMAQAADALDPVGQ